jgi:phosphonopyruvate decarboxylase
MVAKTAFPFTREEAIRLIIKRTGPGDIVVSTTGKASRELFEGREERGEGHEKDFLTVGSMGHASQIALGIALARPERTVVCLDGDGALLMHLGALAIVGEQAPANFKHIILNNGSHESVGGQPTAGFKVDIPAIARACGYRWAAPAVTAGEIAAGIQAVLQAAGPALLEIRVSQGARKDLGRPTTTPRDNKEAFMKYLSRP